MSRPTKQPLTEPSHQEMVRLLMVQAMIWAEMGSTERLMDHILVVPGVTVLLLDYYRVELLELREELETAWDEAPEEAPLSSTTDRARCDGITE